MITKLFISIAAVGLFCACQKEMTTESLRIDLEEYDTLKLESVYTIELTQDTVNFAEIIGAARIIDKIHLNQTNGRLIFSTEYNGNWMHPAKNKVTLRLHTNGLHRIEANETCNIRSTNALTGNEIGLIMTSKLNEATLELNCTTFYYWNNFPCGGKLTLTGDATDLKLWNTALMAVDAQNLTCQNAHVENASKGDCKLTCLKQLTCALRGEGNIYLWGNPPSITITEQSSSGQLIKH